MQVQSLIAYDLEQLLMPKVDLLLIHTPATCNSTDQITLTWKAMQAALKANMTAAIGVSNFLPAQLQALASAQGVTVTPAVNQIGLHVGSVDTATLAYCKKAGIMYSARSSP
jgi:diketogulonate reductase-like aldo/keto reductase